MWVFSFISGFVYLIIRNFFNQTFNALRNIYIDSCMYELIFDNLFSNSLNFINK